MTRLDDFAANDHYTVDGEAGMIAHVLKQIGAGDKMAVEFGAGDGLSCSNTATLWREQGWTALLIEPDHQRFQALEGNAKPFDTTCVQGFVRPGGLDSIGERLKDHGIESVDLMSIDVDGDDYLILRSLPLSCRPRLIVVEFNPTIPPHVAMWQPKEGQTVGASLLAITITAAGLGYRFVGASRCNAFLVLESEAEPFDEYETNLGVLFPPDRYTYAVTDFQGRVMLCGQPLPWTAREPYVLPVETNVPVMSMSNSPQYVRLGFESLWGPAWWLSPDGLSSERLSELLMGARPPLVCIDVTSAAPETRTWMLAVAAVADYRPLLREPVLGLIRGEP